MMYAYNNKMKGMDAPEQAMTRKDVLDVTGAMLTLVTLCPAMCFAVQMLVRTL